MEVAEKWDEPAYGPGRFMGRGQSVAALVRALRSGSCVSLLGGAKLGKTSLLRQAALAIGSQAVVVSGVDLLGGSGSAAGSIAHLVEAQASGRPAATEDRRAFLLVDDADALAVAEERTVLEALVSSARRGGGASAVALGFAGSRRWHEAASSADSPLRIAGLRLKPFPMVVWDRRLAGALIAHRAPDAPISLAGRLTRLSGHHPFLLKGLLSQAPDVDAALEACREDFERAFAAWLGQMVPGGSGEAGLDARPLMRLLAESGKPVSFDLARRRLGLDDVKPEADLLCWLGVIERRLQGERATATLRAGCSLFNEWFLARA